MILLAGPCVIESRDNILRIAEELAVMQENKKIDFYFKASFDKANRTSLESFRGPGLDEGLKVLQEVKEQFGYKIITDFHTPDQATPVAEVANILQIPAFLCRQTDMIVQAAKTKAIVNIKKGQFVNPKDMQYSVAKALTTRGCTKVNYHNAQKHGVWLTERGSTFGYGNMVVDMRGLPIMREFAPVLFDATHSVQMPGSGNGSTGGDSSMIPYLSKAAASVGVDGFFFETHFDPSIALSDGPNMLQIDKLKKLLPILDQLGEIAQQL